MLKSHLKPPKQAPSAWQIFFTEELQKIKAHSPEERLNVAHVAKDAGQRYAALSDEAKVVSSCAHTWCGAMRERS